MKQKLGLVIWLMRLPDIVQIMPDDLFKEFVPGQLGALPEFAERGLSQTAARRQTCQR